MANEPQHLCEIDREWIRGVVAQETDHAFDKRMAAIVRWLIIMLVGGISTVAAGAVWCTQIYIGQQQLLKNDSIQDSATTERNREWTQWRINLDRKNDARDALLSSHDITLGIRASHAERLAAVERSMGNVTTRWTYQMMLDVMDGFRALNPTIKTPDAQAIHARRIKEFQP